MNRPALSRWSSLMALTLTASTLLAQDSEPLQVAFAGNRSLPFSAFSVEGERVTVKTAMNGFTQGQTFPISLASHVQGEKPAAIDQGIARLLLGDPAEALKLFDPVLSEHRVTARIPGNFWIETARAAVLANALNGSRPGADELAKEISSVTPGSGNDPVAALGRALLTTTIISLQERLDLLSTFPTDDAPAEISAYASYFRAELLKNAKREDEALEAYLSVGTLYPTGGSIINGAAELNASRILATRNRREEAVALLHSVTREAKGTALAEEAENRLKSLE